MVALRSSLLLSVRGPLRTRHKLSPLVGKTMDHEASTQPSARLSATSRTAVEQACLAFQRG